MSRRDTIIIALLVNAGLLALLFLLAINTDEEKVFDHPTSISSKVAEPAISIVEKTTKKEIVTSSSVADEVDNFLKELPPEELSQPILVDEEGYVEIEKEKPVAAAVAAPANEAKEDEVKYVEVTVKRGDALERIARNNGTTVEAIKKANNMTTSKLSIGQVLRVPATEKNTNNSTTAKPAKTLAEKSTKPTKEITKTALGKGDPQYYTMMNGDSPWKVAKQFQVDFEDMLRLNGLDEEKARNLKVGDKIRVR